MAGSWRILAAFGGALLLVGCASTRTIEPVPGPVAGLTAAEADARAESVRRDPVAYLHRVTQRTTALSSYSVTLIRQERRGFGIFRALKKPETIACWFRRSPFAVRMKWLDKDTNFGETAYAAGQYGDKVRFVPRAGFLGFPPGIQRVDQQTPVVWGVTKHPVSDFGIQRLMERTLESIADADGDFSVRYLGLTRLEGHPNNVHHLRLSYPPSKHDAPIQELFVDVATDLPACTLIRLPDEKLDAAYYYRDLNTSVRLTDDDFLMECERPRAGM